MKGENITKQNITEMLSFPTPKDRGTLPEAACEELWGEIMSEIRIYPQKMNSLHVSGYGRKLMVVW